MKMIDYIKKEPEQLLENIANARELVKPLVEKYRENGNRRIGLIASGSSYHGAVSARPYMEKCLGVQVRIYMPYSFRYYEEIRWDYFYFFISQSGRSSNIRNAMQKFRQEGRETILVTGNPGAAGEAADCCVDYGVGQETVGYVTIGYVTLALFLMLFALETGLASGQIDDAAYREKINELKGAAYQNRAMCQRAENFYKSHQKEMLSLSKAFICGAGANYGTALEGALKLGETVRIPVMACEIEEFLHGPNIQLTPEYTVFLLDNGDEAGGRVREIFHALQVITDKVYLLGPSGILAKGEDREEADDGILAQVRPLCDVVCFQCLSYWIPTDLDRWREHPLFLEMERQITYKINDKTEEQHEK